MDISKRLLFEAFSLDAHRSRGQRGDNLEKPNSILEQKDAKDAKNTQIPGPIRWRPTSPLGFSPDLRVLPSRSYVRGFLPRGSAASAVSTTGRQLGKPNSIFEQKDAKDAKNTQIRSPIGWGPASPLGFSPIFAPFAILCSRLSPPMVEVWPHGSRGRPRFGRRCLRRRERDAAFLERA